MIKEYYSDQTGLYDLRLLREIPESRHFYRIREEGGSWRSISTAHLRTNDVT